MINPLLFLAAIALSTQVNAQSTSPSVDLADPSTLVAEPNCASQCEAVYSDCRAQCGEETVRAREERLELSNGGQGGCLQRCLSDATLCKQACGKSRGE